MKNTAFCADAGSLANEYLRAKQNYVAAKRAAAAEVSASGVPRSATNAESPPSTRSQIAPAVLPDGFAALNHVGPSLLEKSAANTRSRAGIRKGNVMMPSHIREKIVNEAVKRLNLIRPRTGILETSFETLEEIEAQLMVEVKTSGLRRGRERAMIDLVRELKETRRSVFSMTENMLAKWAAHADECALSAVRQIDSSDRQLMEMAKERDDAIDACKRALSESKAAKIEANQAREDVVRIKTEAEDSLAVAEKGFVEKLKKEVERLQAAMTEESKRAAQEVEEAHQSEKKKYVDDMSLKMQQLQLDNETLRKESSIAEAKANQTAIDFQEQSRISKEHEKASIRLATELNASRRLAEERQDEIKRREAETNELRMQRQQRKKELDGIDERVRTVLANKEAQLKAAKEQAKKAESRARKAEEFISSLENGFAEKPPGHSNV